MGDAARARVAGLGWEPIMTAVEQVYTDAIHHVNRRLDWCPGPTDGSAQPQQQTRFPSP